MTVLHLEIPHGRLGPVRHHRRRSAVRDGLGHMFATIAEWRRRARGRAELAALDEIADVGVEVMALRQELDRYLRAAAPSPGIRPRGEAAG